MNNLYKTIIATATFEMTVPDEWSDDSIEDYVKNRVDLIDSEDTFLVVQIEELNGSK
jgi:adenosylcobinamide amidohydrolase